MLNELLKQLQEDKDDPTANTILEARALKKEHRQEEALYLCDALLETEKDPLIKANIMHEKALIYNFTDNYDMAIFEMGEAIQELMGEEQSFKDMIGHFSYERGSLYLKAGDAVSAADDFEFAETCGIAGAELTEKKAEAYLLSGEYRMAINAYSDLIRSFPRNENFIAARAQAYLKLGNFGKSLSDTKKALEINPDHPKTNTTMAIVLTKLNRPDEALPFYARAIELNPDNDEKNKIKEYRAQAKIAAFRSSIQDQFDKDHTFDTEKPYTIN